MPRIGDVNYERDVVWDGTRWVPRIELISGGTPLTYASQQANVRALAQMQLQNAQQVYQGALLGSGTPVRIYVADPAPTEALQQPAQDNVLLLLKRR